ncbi:glycosyltransferase family 8 protein [Campylobacter helveticus]|uniref:Glycosyltransferase family 8 protein n=1 Tax=Campylobacter helveticus TaxID=28898 RepID=A0AAX2UH63_9BACT|nr:glycosyltransferase family 8 protein [Campylobacter helveticus]TNB55416.1 glycosyltransferase family 8 protein [Campylobacter helveticus]
MFQIVFGCNEAYVKYLSVLITSIMKNVDSRKSIYDIYKKTNISPKIDINTFDINGQEGFVFHILINSIQEETSMKLKQMIGQLSKECNYPAEIKLHIMNDKLFENMEVPIWVEHYATYFRLYLGSILPESCEKCLYLDVDMLVFSDLRELFCLDLQDYLVAASKDVQQWQGTLFVGKSKDKNIRNLTIEKGPLYFNAGFMLINLKQWRAESLEKKMVSVANSHVFEVGDQDILNYGVNRKVLMLPCKWNFIAGHFVLNRKGIFNDFKGEGNCPYWDYTRKEMEENLKDLRILHYTHYVLKPWKSYYEELDMNYRPLHYDYYDEWWKVAFNVPIFNKELIELKNELDNKSLGDYSKTLAYVLNYKMANLASIRIQNHLAYKIGNLILNTRKIHQIVKFPFLFILIIFRHSVNSGISKILFNAAPHLKPLPLVCCMDYTESLKFKEHLSYRYGKTVLQCFKYWYKGKIFIIPYLLIKEYKEFKKKKSIEIENKKIK